MLKNLEIISTLTKDEKEKLVTNISKPMMPTVFNLNIKNLDEISFSKTSLGIQELLYSWNEDLLHQFGHAVSDEVIRKNIDIAVTENVSLIKNNKETIYAEDPVLLSNLLGGYYRGVKTSNIPLAINYGLTNEDLIDLKNEKLGHNLNDFYIKPLNQIINLVKPEYALINTNSRYSGVVESNNLSNSIDLIESKMPLISDTLDPNVLDYDQHYSLENKNNVITSVYEEEKLNELVDNLITLKNENLDTRIKEREKTKLDESILYQESTVLLENNNLLPLSSNLRIRIVGEKNLTVFKENLSQKNKYSFSFSMLNYEKLNLKNIITSCKYNNVVIFTVNEAIAQYQNTYLNIEKIVKKLKPFGVKTCLVLPHDNLFVGDFNHLFDAVVFARTESNEDIRNLISVLEGKLYPSGKLIESITSTSEESVKYRRRLDKKVGGLVGYRYLDANHSNVRYPFGYGLSYTKFTSTDIKITKDQVTLQIKNDGSYKGSEVIQVYVGMNNSKIVRPVKELANFVKVTLNPGESKTLTIKIPETCYQVYEPKERKYIVEKGEYTIYVGVSSKDILSTLDIDVDGVEYPGETSETLNDYVSQSSNIVRENFKFTNKYSYLKTTLFAIVNIIFAYIGVLLIYLTSMEQLMLGYFFLIFIPLVILVALFDIVIVKYKYLMPSSQRDAGNAIFGNSQQSINELFTQGADDFVDVTKKDPTKKKVSIGSNSPYSKIEGNEEDNDELNQIIVDEENFNKEILKKYIDSMKSYLLSKGIEIDDDNIDLLFSGLSSNKLVIVQNDNLDLLNKMVGYMNTFLNEFEDEVGVPNRNPHNLGELFSIKNELENIVPTNFSQLVKLANKDRESIYFGSFIFDDKNNNMEVLKDLVPLFENVNEDHHVDLFDERITLSKNLWVVAGVNPNYDVETIDPSIVMNSLIIPLEIKEVEPQEVEETKYVKLSYQDFRFVLKLVKSDTYLSEINYKKVDMLHSFVTNKNSFKVTNKITYSIESFTALLLYLGDEEPLVMDKLFAYKLITLAKILVSEDDQGTLEDLIGKILGEDNSELSLKMFK